MFPHTPKHFFRLAACSILLFFIALEPARALGELSTDELRSAVVTAADYCAFLNSTAGSDPHHLYGATMPRRGGGIMRTGLPGHYSYTVFPQEEKEPIHFVNRTDQARFCNWIRNRRSTDSLSTEEGSYDLDESGFVNDQEETCSLLNHEAIQGDPDLKISTTSFSIIARASLLSLLDSTPYDPSIHASSSLKMITTLAEELEELFLFTGTCLAGESVRRSLEERPRSQAGETRQEFDSRRKSSSDESNALTQEPSDSRIALPFPEASRITLAQRLEEAEAAYQRRTEDSEHAQRQFEAAHTSFKNLKYGEKLQEKEKKASLDYKAFRTSWMRAFETMETAESACILMDGVLKHTIAYSNDPNFISQLQQTRIGVPASLRAYEKEFYTKSVELQQALRYRDALRTQLKDPERTARLIEATQDRQKVEALAHHARWTKEAALKNLISLKKIATLKSSAASIFSSVRKEIQPLISIVPAGEIKEFFRDCATSLFGLDTDLDRETLQGAIARTMHEKVNLLKEKIFSKASTASDLILTDEPPQQSEREKKASQHDASLSNDETDSASAISSVTQCSPNSLKEEAALWNLLQDELSYHDFSSTASRQASLKKSPNFTSFIPIPFTPSTQIGYPYTQFHTYAQAWLLENEEKWISFDVIQTHLPDNTLIATACRTEEQKRKSPKKKKSVNKHSRAPQITYENQEFLGEGALTPAVVETLLSSIEAVHHATDVALSAVSNFLSNNVHAAAAWSRVTAERFSAPVRERLHHISNQIPIIFNADISIDEASDRLLEEWSRQEHVKRELQSVVETEFPKKGELTLEEKAKEAEAHAASLLQELAQEEQQRLAQKSSQGKLKSEKSKKKRSLNKQSNQHLPSEPKDLLFDTPTEEEKRSCFHALYQTRVETHLIVTLMCKAKAREEALDQNEENSLDSEEIKNARLIAAPALTEKEEAFLRKFATEQRTHVSFLNVLKGLYVIYASRSNV